MEVMSPGRNKYEHMTGQTCGFREMVELVAGRFLELVSFRNSSVCGPRVLACPEGLQLTFAQR